MQQCVYETKTYDICSLQKSDGWGRWKWELLSPDGVAPSRTVDVSASVNLPLHHKAHKFSSGTGSPGWSRLTLNRTLSTLRLTSGVTV